MVSAAFQYFFHSMLYPICVFNYSYETNTKDYDIPVPFAQAPVSPKRKDEYFKAEHFNKNCNNSYANYPPERESYITPSARVSADSRPPTTQSKPVPLSKPSKPSSRKPDYRDMSSKLSGDIDIKKESKTTGSANPKRANQQKPNGPSGNKPSTASYNKEDGNVILSDARKKLRPVNKSSGQREQLKGGNSYIQVF